MAGQAKGKSPARTYAPPSGEPESVVACAGAPSPRPLRGRRRRLAAVAAGLRLLLCKAGVALAAPICAGTSLST